MLILLCMHSANEGRHYNVTSSLIGWAHSQNDPCMLVIRCLSWADRFSGWKLWVHEGIIRTRVVYLPVIIPFGKKFLLNFIQNIVISTQVNEFENAWLFAQHNIDIAYGTAVTMVYIAYRTTYTELMKNAPYPIWPSQFVNCEYFGLLC